MGSSEQPPAPQTPDAVTQAPAPAQPPPQEPQVSTAARLAYGLVAVWLLSLGFGVWGAWKVFGGAPEDDPRMLRAQVEGLEQRVTTLARSDQISREANRELQGVLAERQEEIAALRAEVAFYERFVGATAQRRGLTVRELQLRPGQGRIWHFVATVTRNLNHGGVSEGGLTLMIEGTRNGRMEQLAWSDLRQHDEAPPVDYSFRYFQQVEGDIVLPDGFTPARVTVRAAPERGEPAEQSFTWADATGRSVPGA